MPVKTMLVNAELESTMAELEMSMPFATSTTIITIAKKEIAKTDIKPVNKNDLKIFFSFDLYPSTIEKNMIELNIKNLGTEMIEYKVEM